MDALHLLNKIIIKPSQTLKFLVVDNPSECLEVRLGDVYTVDMIEWLLKHVVFTISADSEYIIVMCERGL